MSARDVAAMATSNLSPLLWQQTLSGECDAVLYRHLFSNGESNTDKKEWDIFSIRPSSAGIMFWDEYQKHGEGTGEHTTAPQSLLIAPRHRNMAEDNKVCFCGL
jgi:hypothetical protein